MVPKKERKNRGSLTNNDLPASPFKIADVVNGRPKMKKKKCPLTNNDPVLPIIGDLITREKLGEACPLSPLNLRTLFTDGPK